jgi:hypothetical protein
MGANNCSNSSGLNAVLAGCCWAGISGGATSANISQNTAACLKTCLNFIVISLFIRVQLSLVSCAFSFPV